MSFRGQRSSVRGACFKQFPRCARDDKRDDRGKGGLCDEHPEPGMTLFPEFRTFSQDILERRPFRRMLASITGCMRERNHDPVASEPFPIFEHVSERIPVMSEVLR